METVQRCAPSRADALYKERNNNDSRALLTVTTRHDDGSECAVSPDGRPWVDLNTLW